MIIQVINAYLTQAAGGGTPPALISFTVATNAINPTYPASIAAGDFLVGICMGNGSDDLDYSGPSGFSLLGSTTFALTTGVAGILRVFSKVADGSETGTATFTKTAGSANANGAFIVRFTGASGYEGVQTFKTENDSTTPMVSPAVTTTVANALIVNVFGQQQNQTLTEEAGWTEVFDQGANNAGPSDYRVALHYKAAVGIGAQATETPTYASGFRRGVVSFALKP